MPQIPQPQTYTLPPASPSHHHGRTVAAWILAVGVTIATLVAGIGMIFSAMTVIYVGAGIGAAAIIVSIIARAARPGRSDGEDAKRSPDWYGN